jgi:adenylate kinase
VVGKASGAGASKEGKEKGDGEIKNSQLLFDSVWNKLKAKYTEERMIFPKEIIWLMGAPGSGKGTNTPFILEARGITASPVVLSDLLDSPEFRVIKAEGGMISDAQVTETLLETLLQDQYRVGALVDGFPRTEIQVDHVSLLYDRMLTLKRQNPQLCPRPVFRMSVLFVEERTSIERQLARGKRAAIHNQKVKETGIGELAPERPTDMSEKAAAKRYAIFKQHFATLTTLQQRFPFHLINAQDSIEQVRARILKQFEYQSSLELDEETFDAIQPIPLASKIIVHARQNLVKRLDDYQTYDSALFHKVIDIILKEFMPNIEHHAMSGLVLIRSNDPVFEDQRAVNMALDILSERGYSVSFDTKVERFPERVDPRTFEIISSHTQKYYFSVRFAGADIRRTLTTPDISAGTPS